VAIHVAITEAPTLNQGAPGAAPTNRHPAIHIASDSLSSILGIRKAIDTPQDMKEHRHLHLLQGIVDVIHGASTEIHVWKVKSHIGIAGNEEADKAAVEVARGEVPAEQIYQYTRPSNLQDRMYWPYKVHKITSPSEEEWCDK
jgi:hypothetical protein